MDMATMKAVMKAVEEALRTASPALAKIGVTARVGRGTFDREATLATLKIEIAGTSEDGSVESREATAWERNAHRFGFRKEDLGKTVTLCGTTYTILGLRPKARKNPILAQDQSGKKWVLPVAGVRAALYPESGHTCSFHPIFGGPECGRPAKHSRPDFRFGDKTKGEPVTVGITVYMCDEHKRMDDDMRAEAAAEAAGS